MKPELEAEVNQLHADICSALADPNRILILYALADTPRTVNEIAVEAGLSQPTTSRHLKVLRERGLVSATRQGMNVEYSLNDPRIIQALDLLRLVLRNSIGDLITGFTPAYLPRNTIDGKTSIAPYNLITTWYWVYDSKDGARPVRLEDLKAAYFEKDSYRAEVLQALDTNGDKTLTISELKLDTPAKQGGIASRLQASGLNNPRLISEVQPHSINHNIARGDYAIRDCKVCHGDNSRLTKSISLANGGPSSVSSQFVKDANTKTNGVIAKDGSTLMYSPSPENLYIFGHNRIAWIDWFGVVAVLGVLIGVTTHGGLRFYASLKMKNHRAPAVKPVYMYAVYERFWHWLQTFTILLLIFSGLVIHRPDMFGVFSFPQIVVMHNVLAAILVINAALSLFYHLASGEIQQFIPRPYGFFDQAIVQAKYYLQGIFKREPHPFEKTPQKKLNPLQQITYFGILNILLPLQVITGALMWGVQSFPQISDWLGGLPFLAPFHSLVAWSFAAFIIAHVYLTTTGHEPLANMKAMMLGWDEVANG